MDFPAILSQTGAFTLNISYWELIGAPLILLIFLVTVLTLVFKHVKKPAGWSQLAWLILFSLLALAASVVCFVLVYPLLT